MVLNVRSSVKFHMCFLNVQVLDILDGIPYKTDRYYQSVNETCMLHHIT